MRWLRNLKSIVLLFQSILASTLIMSNTYAQTTSTHTVFVNDDYTHQGIDSAFVKLFNSSNIILDSNYTKNGLAVLVFTPVSVNDENSNIPENFYIGNPFPQPSKTAMSNVDFGISNNVTLKYSLYNSIGELIFSETKETNAGNYNLKINLSNLAKGIYFVSINSNNDRKVAKILNLEATNYMLNFSGNFSIASGNIANPLLKTSDGSDYRLDVSKEKYDDASVITDANDGESTSVSLSRNNSVEINVYDQHGSLVDMVLNVTGNGYEESINNGEKIDVKSGTFNVSNSAEEFSRDFEIPSIDTVINYERTVKEMFSFLAKYIDGVGVSNLPLKLGSFEGITDSDGSMQLELFPGEYRITSSDLNILLDTLVNVNSDVDLKVYEKIVFGALDLSAGEYDTLRFSSPISFPGSVGTSEMTSLDDNLVVEKVGDNEYTAHAKTFGDFEVEAKGTSEHGTIKDSVYTISFEDMILLNGTAFGVHPDSADAYVLPFAIADICEYSGGPDVNERGRPGDVIKSLIADENGQYIVDLPHGKKYMIRIKASGHQEKILEHNSTISSDFYNHIISGLENITKENYALTLDIDQNFFIS